MEGTDFKFKTGKIWKPQEVVGLDVGSKTIKAVQIKQKGKLSKLSGYGQFIVPDNYIIEGIISEPEKLAKELKAFFSEEVWGKITADRIAMSIPESKVFTRILTLPRAGDKSREEAIAWEASQIIPMAVSDLYMDWHNVGPNKTDSKNDDIIFAAAPKGIVNSYVQLAQLMGLELISVETTLSAVTKAMVPTKNISETVLVVDIGHKSTNMAIFDQYIRVTGSVLSGGDRITERIAEALKINEVEAEKIKVKKDETNQQKVKEAIDAELDEITREIQKMIRYYNEKINDQGVVSRVLLCGGSVNFSGIAEFLTEKLELKTEVGNPWSNISIYPIKPVPKDEAPVYAAAIGLALTGVKND